MFYQTFKKNKLFKSVTSLVLLLCFGLNMTWPAGLKSAWGQTMPTVPGFNLPAPGTMLSVSPSFTPTILKGIIVHPNEPFQFDFIVDTGDAGLKGEELKKESNRLIKYFLAALTVPENELWVNLSPYEKDRIIPERFGQTEMGRDLLGQDYILKQLTASLIYPETDLGKTFWARVYQKAQELYGTTEIPVNTFNKVWIMPDKVAVYENGNQAFIVESHLKVLTEEDYLALQHHLQGEDAKILPQRAEDSTQAKAINNVSSQIIKEIVLPEIEKEVNQGKNFTQLRQICNSLILALWYKQTLKENILNRVYTDKNKIQGVDLKDKDAKEKIYEQYLAAFKKGVYDYIKEDYDTTTRQLVPRKYFSGGFAIDKDFTVARRHDADQAKLATAGDAVRVNGEYGRIGKNGSDKAMLSRKELLDEMRKDLVLKSFVVDDDIMAVMNDSNFVNFSPESSNIYVDPDNPRIFYKISKHFIARDGDINENHVYSEARNLAQINSAIPDADVPRLLAVGTTPAGIIWVMMEAIPNAISLYDELLTAHPGLKGESEAPPKPIPALVDVFIDVATTLQRLHQGLNHLILGRDHLGIGLVITLSRHQVYQLAGHIHIGLLQSASGQLAGHAAARC